MRVARIDARTLGLLGTHLLLGTGWGISIAITPLFYVQLGLSAQTVGALAGCFGVGLLLAALPAGLAVRSFSPRRILVLASLSYAALIATFPHLRDARAFGLFRLLDGACTGFTWVSTEVLLLASATVGPARRMSAYAVASAAGCLIGPLLVRGLLQGVPFSTLYLFAAGFALAAALVATLFRAEPPVRHPSSAPVAFASLARKLRVVVATGFVYGAFHATLLALLPIYFVRAGILRAPSALLLPASFVFGLFLGAPALGRLADRVGHLATLRALSLAAAAICAAFLLVRGELGVLPLAFVAGAAIAAVHPIALALQSLQAGPEQAGRSNALYGGAYALGRLVGPMVCGVVLGMLGGEAMIALLTAAWAGLALLGWAWRSDENALVAEAA